MKISLDDLRSLPQLRLDVSFNEKLDGTEAVKPIVGELKMTAGSTGIHLTGRVQTLLKLHCHRCLRPYFQSLAVDIDERFVIQELRQDWEITAPRDRELAKAEHFAETLPPDNVLDVSDVVYQAVTLATPHSCSCGSDCPGPAIPAKSGKKASLGKAKDGRRTDGPVDPRWKNLKSLFPNDD